MSAGGIHPRLTFGSGGGTHKLLEIKGIPLKNVIFAIIYFKFNIMRNNVIYFILAVIFFVSCGKDDVEEVEKVQNPMIGTAWEAKDEIASFLYGESISRIEFLNNTEFIDISISKGVVRDTDDGTYTYSDSKVVLTYPKGRSDGTDRILNCEVKGSLLITDQGQPSGGVMTYQKK